MKIFVQFLILILLATTIISPAQAAKEGLSFKPTFMYYTNKVSSATTSGTTYQWLDLTIGYTFSSGVVFGGTYHTPSFTSHGTTDCTYQISGFGPTLGYVGEAAFILGTYYIDNRRTGCANTLKGGTHYQVDAGYRFNVSSSIEIAPQLTYYSFQFSEDETASATLNPKLTYFGFTPMLALFVHF